MKRKDVLQEWLQSAQERLKQCQNEVEKIKMWMDEDADKNDQAVELAMQGAYDARKRAKFCSASTLRGPDEQPEDPAEQNCDTSSEPEKDTDSQRTLRLEEPAEEEPDLDTAV